MSRFFILFLVLSCLAGSAQTDTLRLNYHAHSPFAYTENGVAKGIEVDIMNEFVLWLNTKKQIKTTFQYKEYSEFTEFYNDTRNGPENVIGLGSATITKERLREIDYSAPYLRNVAFCITNGHAPDVKTKKSDEIVRSLGSMNALTLPNTSLDKYVKEIKKNYISDLNIIYHNSEVKILDEISRNVLAFGYVDAIGFWFYVKNNPQKFLKMQKILSKGTEEMGFIMPKGSKYKVLFDEFFAAPGGFKFSPSYRAILEKHLGSYMAQNVAIK